MMFWPPWRGKTSEKCNANSMQEIDPRRAKSLLSCESLPARPTPPRLFFLRWYLMHGMWRCGWPGLIHCAKGAIYSFLTEAKRYENLAMERVPPVEPDIAALEDY